MPDTPLGQIVSIQSEKESKTIKAITSEQRRMHREWRTRWANWRLSDPQKLDRDMEALAGAFEKMFVKKLKSDTMRQGYFFPPAILYLKRRGNYFMSKLINCKSCNAEIAKSAKVCPQCGAKNKKPIYARPLVWVLAIFLVIFAAGINGLSQNIPTSSSDSPKLTLEKYNQIQNGMTYEEVINIIGFGVSPEVEMGEKGSELYTASYRYMGNDQVKGSIGANASFMFQGGKLNTKSQLGLE